MPDDMSSHFALNEHILQSYNDIQDALLGRGKYVAQGCGSLVTSLMIPTDFQAFPQIKSSISSGSWRPINESQWRKDHPNIVNQFTHVYCFDGASSGAPVEGGHSVAIVGYISNVYAQGMVM